MRLLCSSMPSCLKSGGLHSWCGKPTAMNLQFGKFYKGPFLVIFGDNVLSGLPQYQLRHGDVSPTGTLLTNKTSKVHNDTAIFCQNNLNRLYVCCIQPFNSTALLKDDIMFPTLAPVPILWTCQGQPFRAARRTLQAMASYGKLWQAMASYGKLWPMAQLLSPCLDVLGSA